MLVPLGAVTGFSLPAEIRVVAGYYGVRAKSLRAMRGRCAERMTLARHALFWQLATQRRLSVPRVAQMLHVPTQTVRDGVAAHQARILEFITTAGAITSAGGEDAP